MNDREKHELKRLQKLNKKFAGALNKVSGSIEVMNTKCPVCGHKNYLVLAGKKHHDWCPFSLAKKYGKECVS